MNRFTTAFLAVVLLAVSPLTAGARLVKAPEQSEGVILSKSADADTVFVKPEHGPAFKVRLHYADAPEIAHNSKQVDQPGGREALEYVKKRWEGKSVTVTVRGKSYDRMVGDVVEKNTGKNMSLDLVSRGLAVCDPKYHPPAAYKAAEAAAKLNHLGIFKDTQTPVTPWDWRKQTREKK